MTEVAVFGHSFVAHLERYMAKDPARQNFGLHYPMFRVRLHGMPGFSLEQKARLAKHEDFVRGAGILILEIGTNDLADIGKDPRAFANELIELALKYLNHFSVGKVIISQILFREASNLPYETYNDHVTDANLELEEKAKLVPNVFFWKHRGVWKPDTNIYDLSGRFPGVHLNDIGNWKYLKSLREAVLHVKNW